MLRKVIVIIGIILLTFSFTAGAAEKKDVKAQPPLCKEVTALIKSGEIKKDRYRFETVDIPDEPHSYEYVNIDIDRDGISDKVTISSGSVESLLVIQLSSGGEYELDEGLMRLVKLKGQIYALVTYWDKSVTDWKLLGHRLYKLTKNKAKLVCDTEDLKGGK